MSRIVVAGGAGFLGSHLCDAFIARGDEVVCIDNLSTGRLANIEHLYTESRFTFIKADVSYSVPVDGHLDAICHLASPASPPAYLARPMETLLVGSEGTRRLLELADQSTARFLLASTSEVYGDPREHPQSESYRGNVDPTGPRSVYDEAKRFAEAMSMASHRARGTNIAIARIFNTYGPRLAPGDGRVVSNFIVQALRSEALCVYGDGLQTRSLCFIDDEVRGLIGLLFSSEIGPMNIGNPDERSVLQIAEAVLVATGSHSTIVYQELPKDDPVRRCPNINLATSVLGWTPVVDFEDGLARTVEYFRNLMENEESQGS